MGCKVGLRNKAKFELLMNYVVVAVVVVVVVVVVVDDFLAGKCWFRKMLVLCHLFPNWSHGWYRLCGLVSTRPESFF